MGTKVFVGNFSFSVNEDGLREYFSSIGSVVSAKVMTDAAQGGRSRGFGFVEFQSEDDAAKAIRDLDGVTWEGRVLKVSEDRSQRREGGGYHHQRNEGDGEGEGGRYAPTGYFRAQPFDLGIRKRKKLDPFVEDENLHIDFKDTRLLVRFMSERGRILPRRMTGLTSANQRQITRAIKRAQQVGLLPVLRA